MGSVACGWGDTHRDLAPQDISGTSDPFARVIFNNHSAETLGELCVCALAGCIQWSLIDSSPPIRVVMFDKERPCFLVS